MKKILFVIACVCAITFASCGGGNATSTPAADSTSVDTVMVDTLAVDSVVVDSIM